MQSSHPPPPTPLALCTCEAKAIGDHARVLADRRLTRAVGRLLELSELPGQAVLHGRGRNCRASRPRACAHVHTGRTRVPIALARAAPVRRVPGGYGPWPFACTQPRQCLCLDVSGMLAGCACERCERRANKLFCMNLLTRLGVKVAIGTFRRAPRPHGGPRGELSVRL